MCKFEDILYIAVNTFHKVQYLIPLGIQKQKTARTSVLLAEI